MNAAVTAGGRTPFCRPGGQLRDVSVFELAERAADGLEWTSVVAATTLPGVPDLAARLARGGRAIQLGGGDGSGLEAVAAGAALVDDGPVLVVGADSASQSPFLVPRAPWGAGAAARVAVDPLAAVVAGAGRRSRPIERAAQDEWAARSRAAVGAGDEPRTYGELADLKPLFAEDGGATAASTALPADGAGAVVLDTPAPGDLTLLAIASDPAAVLPDDLVAAEIHEGTAGEVLAIAAELSIDPHIVNATGGAIGLGHPVAASGVAMVLRLRDRLQAAGGGAGLLVAPGIAIAAAV